MGGVRNEGILDVEHPDASIDVSIQSMLGVEWGAGTGIISVALQLKGGLKAE